MRAILLIAAAVWIGVYVAAHYVAGTDWMLAVTIANLAVAAVNVALAMAALMMRP